MPVSTITFDDPADQASTLHDAFVMACTEHGVAAEAVTEADVTFIRFRTGTPDPLAARKAVAELSDEELAAELERRGASTS